MADASPESIQQLIEIFEKGLAQIEMSLPQILKTRKAVEEEIEQKGESDVVLDRLLVVLDTLLAENEVIYDLSASFDALLKANDDYAKRYYMQSLNLCFLESYQLFVGDEGDEYGLLSKIEELTRQRNQTGCQLIVGHIINDIQAFREEYTDRELRNITRHYDEPIKMYEKQQDLRDIDFFAKGASQLMAICMEVRVVSSFLLTLLTPVKKEPKYVASPSKKSISKIVNDAIFKAFKKKDVKKELQRVLEKGQSSLDECYRLYKICFSAISFLIERDCQIQEGFQKLESLLRLRMEALFLRNDVACSIWGYLNASSDLERSQNLRHIYITKQAALTHIYGYNEKARGRSLWARIKEIEESGSEKLKTAEVEKSLEELTGNLAEDRSNSNVFAHYRHQQNFYIPARLEAFNKMQHHKELFDALKLFNVCKDIEGYTVGLLCCIHEGQRQKTKQQHDEWVGMIDNLAAKFGNDEKANETLKPIRELTNIVFGNDTKAN